MIPMTSTSIAKQNLASPFQVLLTENSFILSKTCQPRVVRVVNFSTMNFIENHNVHTKKSKYSTTNHLKQCLSYNSRNKDCNNTPILLTPGRDAHSPKVKPRVLISALLQITMDTDDTTDRLKAPIVPSWNFWLSPISTLLALFQQQPLPGSVNGSKHNYRLTSTSTATEKITN